VRERIERMHMRASEINTAPIDFTCSTLAFN